MSQLTEFYSEVGPDNEGRYLDDILTMDDDWFETCHDFIQWLFPLKEPSNFNPDAPIMTEKDILFLSHSMNYKAINNSVERFMYFLGMGWSHLPSATNAPLVEDEKKFAKFIPLNHNHLRMTRMLTFLKLIGRVSLAKDILEGILLSAKLLNLEINSTSLKYWEEAVCEG